MDKDNERWEAGAIRGCEDRETQGPVAGPQREEHQVRPHFFAIIPLEQR